MSDINQNPVLEWSSVSKTYGKVQALNKLDLSIHAGQVFGILGPNGSGKSTSLGIATGLVNKDEGEIRWFGTPNSSYKNRLGIMFSSPAFYPYLSAQDNLKITALQKEVSLSRIPEVLEFVNLSGRSKDKVKTFSTGMKQRLALAAAILNDPEVLILDEPTNGLDPEGIAEVRDLIKDLTDINRTIILASHLLEEVEKVCSHVAIINKGKILDHGSVSDLLSSKNSFDVQLFDQEYSPELFDKCPIIESYKIESTNFIRVDARDGVTGAEINKFLFEYGLIANAIIPVSNKLEDHFLKLVKANAS